MRHLIIGADPFPPYQYIDKNKNICGSDYDTVSLIIDRMGYKADYIIQEWSLIEKKFNNKEIDIVFQVQKTPEREKLFYFSEKLRDAVTSIVTSTNKVHYGNIEGLFEENSKLGVIENYKYGEIIDSIGLENKKLFKSIDELLKSVNDKKVAFGVVDLGVFNHLNRQNIYNNIRVLDDMNFNRPLYVAFNDKTLRDEFNIYLCECK